MGTGIGEYCKICNEQLNDDDGYDYKKKICYECIKIMPKFLKFLVSEWWLSEESENEK